MPGLSNTPPENEALLRAVIVDVRLPRILLTFLVGGALATSGAALQAMFRILVSPDILGLSSGAAFGGGFAGLVTPWLPIQLSAFGFGVLAAGLSYSLARTGSHVSTVALILAGIIVGGVFTAALTVVQFLTDPFKLAYDRPLDHGEPAQCAGQAPLVVALDDCRRGRAVRAPLATERTRPGR